jgi:hypothetical protein
MAPLLWLLYLALGLVQIVAFLAGIQLWLGMGTFFGLVIFFVTAVLPFGYLFDAAVAFYGAYKGWDWPSWQAALLAFPFAIVGVVITAAGGIVGLLRAKASQIEVATGGKRMATFIARIGNEAAFTVSCTTWLWSP